MLSDDFGGAKGIRTPDLYNANVARYQLCYSPKYSRRILCRFDISCFAKELSVRNKQRMAYPADCANAPSA